MYSLIIYYMSGLLWTISEAGCASCGVHEFLSKIGTLSIPGPATVRNNLWAYLWTRWYLAGICRPLATGWSIRSFRYVDGCHTVKQLPGPSLLHGNLDKDVTALTCITAALQDTRYINVGLSLTQHLRRWPSVKPHLSQRIVFAGTGSFPGQRCTTVTFRHDKLMGKRHFHLRSQKTQNSTL